ncbi:MAG: hypothetical protein R2733_17115 [Acidimicrobiales bacterium]
MLVQCHDRFDLVAEFTPESGLLKPRRRPPGLSPTGTDGWYATLDGVNVVFYRSDGRLWLSLDDRVFDLDGETSVAWHDDGPEAVFAVADEGGQVLLRYPKGPDLSDDPTAHVSDEDWDLGLFIANVMFDEERTDLVRRGPQ